MEGAHPGLAGLPGAPGAGAGRPRSGGHARAPEGLAGEIDLWNAMEPDEVRWVETPLGGLTRREEIHACRDFDRDSFTGCYLARSTAAGAGIGYDLAVAATGRACRANSEKSLAP